MPPPNTSLPVAARQAAWDNLWRVLLSPPPAPPPDTTKPAGDEPAGVEGGR